MKSADKEKHRVQKKMKVTAEEDRKLRQLVYIHGENNWEEISKRMQNRNVRQCHDRWHYYLSPNINTSVWTTAEENTLLEYVEQFGSKWIKIASMFPGRNDIQIKNKWNSLKRKYSLSKPLRIEVRETDIEKEGTESDSNKDELDSLFDPNLRLADFPIPYTYDAAFDI
ncbi:Myb-like DNA-binding domain containing protein [Trichomonas vaginalis G3]|uniref:Myb-like DNA-binding domain containing protein n=1 Tax=Trichomonas vaginalis (strain ATCC PRA-98 / G3) TaxID=412133 RepID=A2FFX0_TRIV3|nr:RNA polymerase II transcription regulator recruiting protein [Trichomonas vaginalis G3]EAX96180.1 Myb-like DNA-binding domain containing protein [Trichomonas vaginalis G3]KAI5506310.1 RNA polymerase II transcription regulator recruiting protein [Trichomonas vaginalis G3]|eukprot:XP_001309110.1 Myb-like DNA-binding domain containing protein [Trichomonas vaginalis G3]